MNIVSLLAGPIIGGVIGYFTNYIAVKMLFRPKKAIQIGSFTLPFTPGIIPKRKPALAHAIGQAVGNNLVDEEELAQVFHSEAMKETIVMGIRNAMDQNLLHETIHEVGQTVFREDEYMEKKEQVAEWITNKITEGFLGMDVGNLIATEGAAAIQQKGGMLAMFINQDMIASLATPIGNKVDQYVQEQGKEKIRAYVANEITEVEGKTPGELLNISDSTKVDNMISAIYDAFVEEQASKIAGTFDIQGIVEEKINAMDVSELETLIMSVMKHELGTIVNLGAIIGFLIGLLNLLF
ncbi:DUF445 domain-containing protein [Anaerosporobacter faecicola]|uniref:DUF445 domain-containing protein n=1 Tax=Anaerosporobacter faecicola TaxID=2718714 RepID=UPI00143ABD8C|nr:DUF445 family protein [Anaerosporobacter faecicola]